MQASIILAVLSLLVIAGDAAADNTVPPVRVGVLASLTGNWAAIGRNIEEGTALAAEELHASGGIQGARMEFDIQDTDEEKSGAKVVTAYTHLKTKGINLFLGPTGVPGALALTPFASKDDVVLLGPTATNSFYKKSSHFFNCGGDNVVTTKAIAEYIFKTGTKKVAIFGSLQPWEEEQAKTFSREFAALGGIITAEVYPAADQTDLRTEALKMSSGAPEAIFLANFNEIAHAAKALRNLKFSGKLFSAMLDDDHLRASEGALEGNTFYLFDPPAAAFKEKFENRYGHVPGIFADSAYDAAYALGLALRASPSRSSKEIAAALHTLHFISSSGNMVRFSADGLLERGISLLTVKNGEIVPLPN